MLLLLAAPASGQERESLPQENFYANSLHYTGRGIEYLYSKEQGGIERITGLSATEVGCRKSNCHVQSCDACHAREVGGKLSYTTDATHLQAACLRCHSVEKDDPDVHLRNGMKCMDCHSAREVHGDGFAYNSYMQPGALDARCEKYHREKAESLSHTVHKGKVDCNACHVRDIPTCYNCHLQSRMKEKKETSVSLKEMVFLVNHDGRVTTANFLSYVYRTKTVITLAPTFPHLVKKEGRICAECHDTKIVRDIKNKTFRLVLWESGSLRSVKGVIPVLEGMKWDLVFLDKENDRWMVLKNPEEPIVNSSGYCSPLSASQFENLSTVRGVR